MRTILLVMRGKQPLYPQSGHEPYHRLFLLVTHKAPFRRTYLSNDNKLLSVLSFRKALGNLKRLSELLRATACEDGPPLVHARAETA